ncbi:MAG TPA: Sir2 family NAD-dependent protein deacetylase [Tepidiformaceae bacterium]|nr:Sir2 family NAD-dependent protein deacetylase [Tepidiformaceae bacterium]
MSELPEATREACRAIAALLRDAALIVALSGAGISTESGIPDFRGPQGVWTKDPEAEKRATLQHYMANRDTRVRAWQGRRESPLFSADANAGHRALAEIAAHTRFDLLVTQNIDGLHQKGGFPAERVVEIHGTVHEFTCMGCGERGDIHRVIARVEAGEEDPPCRTCGGILKSATISFGQQLVASDLERAMDAASRADVFLAIGTTLGVYPAANMPIAALQEGARLVILNAQPTPFDEYASIIVREPLGEVLPLIASALRN